MGSMKGEKIGEFEELLLLTLMAMTEERCAVPMQRYLEPVATRRLSLGAIYAGLHRLEAKGLVRSCLGEPTAQRGGKRKRLFYVTRDGVRAVRETRRIRDAIWRIIDARRLDGGAKTLSQATK